MDYLAIREAYKLAYHKWDQFQQKLCGLLDCEFAELEEKLTEVRSDRRWAGLIQEYAQLHLTLDAADRRWEIAQAFVARSNAINAQLNKDIALLDC